ncbi:MAG: ParA family protein [Actinomycetota bacterium]
MTSSPGIIAVFNAKGGVGKTTTAVNLAVCLAMMGRRVLLVDMDAQGNATTSFGSSELPGLGTYELITGRCTLAEAMRPTFVDNLWLVGATDGLNAMDLELAGDPPAHGVLRDIVATQGQDLDLVVIDCPPGVGAATVNALVSAHGVLCPANPTPFAHDGLARTWAMVGRIRAALNPELRVVGVVMSLVDDGVRVWQDDVAAVIRAEFGALVFPQPIGHAPDLFGAAAAYGVPAVMFAPIAAEVSAFIDLALWLLAREPRLGGEADERPVPPRAVVCAGLQSSHLRLAKAGYFEQQGNIPALPRGAELGIGPVMTPMVRNVAE